MLSFFNFCVLKNAWMIPLLLYFILLHVRCKKWVQYSRRADLQGKSPEDLYKSCVLCSLHFEENQFMNAQQHNKLIWNAVPTSFDVPNPPKPLTCKRALPERKRDLIDKCTSKHGKFKLKRMLTKYKLLMILFNL